MACDPNIMAILKGTSVKLDDDNILILAFMYHTEKGDRSKSEYRYEGRIMKIADLKAEIAAYEADPTASWKWPNLDQWDIAYDRKSNNERAAKWFKARLSKALPDWDTFIRLCRDGIKVRQDGSEKSSENAKYDLVEYVMDNERFDITTLEDALTRVGKNFSKKLILKRTLPKN